MPPLTMYFGLSLHGVDDDDVDGDPYFVCSHVDGDVVMGVYVFVVSMMG